MRLLLNPTASKNQNIAFQASQQNYGTCYGENNQRSLARGHSNLGDVFFSMDDFVKAETHYQEAKKIYQQINLDKFNAILNAKIQECSERK